jgi:hypothetical protein
MKVTTKKPCRVVETPSRATDCPPITPDKTHPETDEEPSEEGGATAYDQAQFHGSRNPARWSDEHSHPYSEPSKVRRRYPVASTALFGMIYA